MRTAVCLLAVTSLLLGAHTLAQGEDGEMKKLKDRLHDCEYQLKYLRSRERAMTAYMLMNSRRADGLDWIAARTTELGFTNAAITPASREFLLDGLTKLAGSLREDLPVVSEEEMDFLKQVKSEPRPPKPDTSRSSRWFPHRKKK